MRLGEIYFGGLLNVGISRGAVVTKSRIDHAPGLIEDQLFLERPAERLCDRALDLRLALHRINDHAAVSPVNALQDHNLAANPIDCDAEALHLERDAARGAVSLADRFE